MISSPFWLIVIYTKINCKKRRPSAHATSLLAWRLCSMIWWWHSKTSLPLWYFGNLLSLLVEFVLFLDALMVVTIMVKFKPLDGIYLYHGVFHRWQDIWQWGNEQICIWPIMNTIRRKIVRWCLEPRSCHNRLENSFLRQGSRPRYFIISVFSEAFSHICWYNSVIVIAIFSSLMKIPP